MCNISFKFVLLSVCLITRVICDTELFIEDFEDSNELNYSSACHISTYNKTCCNRNEFRCGTGECVPLDNVCDAFYAVASPDRRLAWYLDKLDCSDGSDEASCFRRPCSKLKNGTCENVCLDLPGNFSKCICNDGYFLKTVFSEKECVDIDECTMGVHFCSHQCVNHVGGYSCKCRLGFEQDLDGLDGYCKARDKNTIILYYSNSWIYAYNLQHRSKKALVPARDVDELDYDPVSENIFWLSEGVISRSRFVPGSENGIPVIDSSLKATNGSFAVDWIAGNIYWLSLNPFNNNISRLMVSKLDGTYTKTLIEVSRPNALVADPSSGLIFFTSSGSVGYPHIGAVRMDGEVKWILANLPGQNPTLLTVDYWADGKLYWMDSMSNTIYYLNRNIVSQPVKVLTKTSREAPLALDVFENHLYWVTKDSYEVVRHDKFGRGETEILLRDLVDQKAFKIYHKSKLEIRNFSDRCTKYSCSHLCLHMPNGFRCDCPDGFISKLQYGSVVCRRKRFR